MDERRVSFGDKNEWSRFAERNGKFLDLFPNLKQLMDQALTGPLPPLNVEKRVIRFLSYDCIEQFMEVMLLAGNGYGHAAQRTVRTLYERAVTINHLTKHPLEVKLFVAWLKISKHKMWSAMKTSEYPKSNWPAEEMQKKIDEEYRSVRPLFEVDDCKKCGTKRQNHSWSRKSLVDMAHSAEGLKPLLVNGYYEPLTHSHPSMAGLLMRLEEVDDTIGYDSSAQPDESDRALSTAQLIMIVLCEQQADFFGLHGVEALAKQCHGEWVKIWAKDASNPASTPVPPNTERIT